MSFIIMHVSGDDESDPPLSTLRDLVEELAEADAEHPDVSVRTAEGWALSAFPDGRVMWENVEDLQGPWFLEGVDRAEVVAMFETLAVGDVASIASKPWLPGG